MADNPFLVVDPPNYATGLVNFGGIGGNKQQPQQQQGQSLGQQLAALLQPQSSQQPATASKNTSASTPKYSSVPPSEYAQLFNDTEAKYGLPAGYLAKTAGIESSYNPRSYNEHSKAAGLFQFIPGTAKQYGLSNPYDAAASTDAAARLAVDDRNQLRAALGRDPTAGELYLAHQQGAGGAIRLLLHPDSPAGQLVGSSAISANAGNPSAPASAFIQRWTSQY